MTRLSGPEKIALALCLVFAIYVWAVTFAQATSMSRPYPWTPQQEAAMYQRVESGEVD